MKLKTLLTTLSFVFVFSQSVFAVESEDTGSIAKNILKFKAVLKCPYCDLSGADFSDLKLGTADLRNANLTGADLRNAYLWLADLRDADLTGADLRDADLTAVFFWNANLTNANLTGADLKRAKLEGAIFCNTKTPWGLDNSGCKKE